MELTFSIPTNVNECNPEIVSAIRAAKTYEELMDLFDEYDYPDVYDAMFGICAEDKCYAIPNSSRILEWLLDELYNSILPDIEKDFCQHNGLI